MEKNFKDGKFLRISKKLIFIKNLFPVLLLIGCTTAYNVTNRNGMGSYQQDKYACELQSRGSTIPERYGVAFDGIRYNEEKNNLFIMCMQAKGYTYTKE
jgi:hypothetical protein